MNTLNFYTGESVLPIWKDVENLLQRAARYSHGEYTVRDLLVLVSSGKQQLWVVRGATGRVLAAATTEILVCPRKTICNIYSMAGFGMEKLWDEFSSVLFTWLRENKIGEVTAYCRDEIADRLEALGFSKRTNVMQLNWKEQP